MRLQKYQYLLVYKPLIVFYYLHMLQCITREGHTSLKSVRGSDHKKIK